MDHFRRDILLIAALLLTSFTPRALADSKQQEGEALVARARQLWAIRAPGNPAFRLKAQFRFPNSKPGEGEGEYLEVWASPQQWRREIVVGDHRQIEVGGEDKRWVLNDLALNSLRLLRVPELLSLGDLNLEQFKVKKIRKETSAGIQAHCVEVKPSDNDVVTFCFEVASGLLLLTVNPVSMGKTSYQYSDYASFGNHSYPHKLRAFSGGTAYLEVEVTELSPEPAPEASLFVSPEGSQQLPVCLKIEPPKPLSDPEPVYPRGQAGNARVMLWIIVGIDGKPSDLRVALSSGDAFDNAALDAVRRWTFRPAMCAGQPIAVQVSIEINFRRWINSAP